MHNKKFFLGGFVFSNNQRKYFESQKISDPIKTIMHPTHLKVSKWSISSFSETPTFLHVGTHCRNIKFFADVAKQRHPGSIFTLLAARERDYKLYRSQYQKPGMVIHMRMDKDEFNKALASSVVFINLLHAAANNTVLECMARGTPILINRVGGVEDYLGKEYPLYYSSKKHAIRLINRLIYDPKLLDRTHGYLLRRRQRLSMPQFLKDVENGLRIMIGTQVL